MVTKVSELWVCGVTSEKHTAVKYLLHEGKVDSFQSLCFFKHPNCGLGFFLSLQGKCSMLCPAPTHFYSCISQKPLLLVSASLLVAVTGVKCILMASMTECTHAHEMQHWLVYRDLAVK